MLHSRRLGTPEGHPSLLAHCFLGHGGSWKAMVEALEQPIDALAPDLPGHGRSPAPAEPGDFHDLTARALGDMVERPSLLIGHSFGAASLLRHALLSPRDATGLVLIEPVFFAVARGMPEYAPYDAEEGPLQDAVAAGDLAEAARRFLALNPGSPDFDRLPEPVQSAMAAQMRLVAATRPGLFGDSGGLLAPGVMESFPAPVLVILGSGTTPIFRAVLRGLTRRLPDVTEIEIDGAGHMAPVTHPQQTAAAIDGWMRDKGLTVLAEAETRNPRVG
ncbi:MAG: alpha/beta hydrolase [Rhodobacteraceae bacterium]|nr:alpha/beta hydrolase [Paracoccaceae bacterium]